MDVYHAVYFAIFQALLGSYVMLLMDFRTPKKRWRNRWLATVITIVCANLIALLFFHYWESYQYKGMFIFSVTIPYILITVRCSEHRDFRAIFGLATALFIACIGTGNASVFNIFFPGNEYLSLLVRSVSFVVMFFVLKRFSLTYRQMLRYLNSGWGILCIIPITTFIILLYTVNVLVPTLPVAGILLFYGLLLVCAGAYYLMHLFFERIQAEMQAKSERDLQQFQVSALQSRMEAVRSVENAIRTERHDLHHRLQAVAELVVRGDKATALDFLGAAQKRLDQQKTIRWCRPPILDAVFSSYFDQARQQGVRIEANLALPDALPVDEGELAAVLANALENAIHANLELPWTERELTCKMMEVPSLMLETSNPWDAPVSFDNKGYPLPQKEGHGTGVQSIFAFCKKYDAVCQFEQTGGRFQFRLIL